LPKARILAFVEQLLNNPAMSNMKDIPTVLVFAGNDPTGGAGIAADITAIHSIGCHAAPVITALTVQDTNRVYDFKYLDPVIVIEQARAVLADMPVDAVKIGMTGSMECIMAIHSILQEWPGIPVVLDPVLSSGAGDELTDAVAQAAMLELLAPLATVLTPNSEEAYRLAPNADTLDAAAQQLMATGCDYILVTGTHRDTPQVINTLYGNLRKLDAYAWPRLPHSYHGSGCTLAAAIAGMLAHGSEPSSAILSAQDYTFKALLNAYAGGSGQLLPDRLFWAREDEEP